MKKRLTNNLGLKIFSVFFATVLWFIVINIQNPIETMTLNNMPIKFLNTDIIDENNLIITNKDVTSVNLRFRGNRLALEKLNKDISTVKIWVDMKYYTKVGGNNPNNMPITIEIPTYLKEYVRVEENPKYVQVTLEENKEIKKNIEIDFKNNVKDGYEILTDKIKIIPSEIIVDGSATNVNQIDKVKVKIDIGNLTKDFKSNVPIKFYNVNGNEITGLRANANVTNVQIPVNKIKTINFKVETINSLKAPLQLTDISITPSQITISGDEDVINRLDDVVTIPIDLSTITESKAIKHEVVLPERVINKQEIDFLTININVR
ncbi:MAG: hypothetical protein A2Y24_08490 [Clostridiales bacterium GWE2_32_10]|nr:MAG: hypothetical protein A2Y24_08490 [Clostridiales bacterium GWE2_32_10]